MPWIWIRARLAAITIQARHGRRYPNHSETLSEAGDNICQAAATTQQSDLNAEGPVEAVLDKGHHSDDVLLTLKLWGVRAYCSEADRGRRCWKNKDEEKTAVYQNRHRIRGERGKRLLRQRGERVERSFAHLYETGGMRRTHLRRHGNILKRLLIHAAAFNPGLVIRRIAAAGTPRQMRECLETLHHTLWLLCALDSATYVRQFRQFTITSVTGCNRVTPERIGFLSAFDPLCSTRKSLQTRAASGCISAASSRTAPLKARSWDLRSLAKSTRFDIRLLRDPCSLT
jgi:hypothetical protein